MPSRTRNRGRRVLGGWTLSLITALLGSACGGDPHLAIDICGDVLVPEDLDAVRLVVMDSGGAQTTGGYIDLLDPDRELDDPCPAVTHQIPLLFDLVEGRGEMLVIAEGLMDGVVHFSSHARAEFPVRGGTPVTLVLARSCMGVSCATGQTCREGRCELIPRGDAAICPEPAPQRSEAERCPPDEDPAEEGDA